MARNTMSETQYGIFIIDTHHVLMVHKLNKDDAGRVLEWLDERPDETFLLTLTKKHLGQREWRVTFPKELDLINPLKNVTFRYNAPGLSRTIRVRPKDYVLREMYHSDCYCQHAVNHTKSRWYCVNVNVVENFSLSLAIFDNKKDLLKFVKKCIRADPITITTNKWINPSVGLVEDMPSEYFKLNHDPCIYWKGYTPKESYELDMSLVSISML